MTTSWLARSVVAITGFCLFGCGTPSQSDSPSSSKMPSIVGVWELTEVRLSQGARWPEADVVNKKDVYTHDGCFHDTDPGSTKKTDMSPRTYKFDGKTVEIYDDQGQLRRTALVTFKPSSIMEMKNNDGSIVVFRKISGNPNIIPKRKARLVPIRVMPAAAPVGPKTVDAGKDESRSGSK